MSRRRRNPSFLELAVKRVGFRKGTNVMSFVVAWAYTEGKLRESEPGAVPSLEQYAVDWKVSTRTAQRELALYRETWPEYPEGPSQLLAAMREAGQQYFSPTAPLPNGLIAGLA